MGAAETDRQIIQKVTILWRSGSTLSTRSGSNDYNSQIACIDGVATIVLNCDVTVASVSNIQLSGRLAVPERVPEPEHEGPDYGRENHGYRDHKYNPDDRTDGPIVVLE